MKLLLSLTAILLVTALASPLAAQTLDMPSVSEVRVSRSSVVLDLQAGASGAPAGIRVEWMYRYAYDAYGWPNWDAPWLVWCEFLSTPTLNTASGTSTYLLGPNEVARVEVGDFFDETGMNTNFLDEIPAGEEVVFRAKALDDGSSAESPWSGDLFSTTGPEDPLDCTHTQGYWKNHASEWPALSLTLGTVVYNQAQLLDIFNTPAAGNGLIFLAHQLIAAKLNIELGAIAEPSVTTAINDADALIGGLVIPPVGGGYLSPASASGLTEILDQFNNGTAGGGECGTTPTRTVTWGTLKLEHR